MKESESGRSSSNSGSPSNSAGVTRRRFVQSTALIGTLSVGAGEIIAAPAAEAEEAPTGRLAQAEAPPPSPRAPVAPARPATPTAAEPPVNVQEFIKLSQVLTGLDDLEPELAAQYLQRCTDNLEVSGQLILLVQTLSALKGGRDKIASDFHDKLKSAGVQSPFFAASEQIIYLWYVGAFFRKKEGSATARYWDYGPPDHYFHGKMWPVIGVQPPMTAHNTTYWTTAAGSRRS